MGRGERNKTMGRGVAFLLSKNENLKVEELYVGYSTSSGGVLAVRV